MNLAEIRNRHFQKRCDALERLAYNRDTLSFLNTALLDQNKDKIQRMEKECALEGIQYTYLNQAELIRNKSRLRIVYLMPHNGITGGVKILIQQSNQLAQKGHEVLLYSHCPKPDWIECNDSYFVVHPENSFSDVIPSADVVIAGYWDSVIDALEIKAPVKYHFAQGDFDVFDFDQLDSRIKNIIGTAYTLPLRILTVSKIMEEKIGVQFGRKSTIIPNALDKKNFYPKKNLEDENIPLEILLVGSDSSAFKGHGTAIEAMSILKRKGYLFEINWITPVELQHDYREFVSDVNQYIAPSQEEIGNIYRKSDIYLCTSFYESFALPVLEAMTCGTCVITSDNGGIRDYCKEQQNSLIFEPGNVAGLVEKLEILFKEKALRTKLKKNGLATSKKYSWNRSIRKLQKELEKSAASTTQAVRC